MNILITYSSKTGNTSKVAEALKAGLPLAHLKPMSEVENLDGYDVVFVGGWIDRGTFNAEALEFTKKVKGKKVAYFFTLGAYPDSDHAKDCVNAINALFEENGNEILGRYFCQGAIDPKLIEFMSSLPQGHVMAPNEARIKRWKDASTHPDNNDLENARSFARSIIDTI